MKRTILLLAAYLLLGLPAYGQTIQQNLWETNGTVSATVYDQSSNTVYIGGNFTYVGPHTGNGVALDANSGIRDAAFPKVNGGILAAVPDGSGGWFIGGTFTSVGGVPRNRIAHILSNKTLNPSWNPDASGAIVALAVSGSTVYAGGNFTSIGGQARNRIAALDATTGAATAWDPDAGSEVYALAVSGTTVYAAGNFNSIGGQTRICIAALDATTGTATGWDPTANNTVRALVVSGSTVYAGGDFTSIGGQARNRIAALDATTGTATGWDPNANSSLYALAVSGSTVYAGGFFSSIGGQTRGRIAALDATTGAATGWNPNANGAVFALAVAGSTIYAGGQFKIIGGQPRSYIAALDATSGTATSWDPYAGDVVQTFAISGSTVYAGGAFTSIGGQTRNRIAALDGTSGTATAWNPDANGNVLALTVSGSTVYAGGSFTSIGGQTRNRIAALDASTGGATSFNPNANGSVNVIAVSGSTVYAGGAFTSIGGQTRNRIAALSATTGAASSWNPNASTAVYALSVSNSVVYVGGGFSSIGGQARNRIAAIDATTGAATGWDPNANGDVRAISEVGSTIYVGGSFLTIGGQTRYCIAALDAISGTASSWDPHVTGTVWSLTVSGSTIYAGGGFNSAGGQPRSRIAALDAITGAATDWDPNASSDVRSLAVNGSTVYAGGFYTSIFGENRKGFAALTNGCDPLVISTPPVNQTKCAGESVTFSVAASGTDLTYQWRKNSVDIPGASSENYTIPSASPGDDGNYDVVIGSSCTPSQTSSVAVLTVNTPPSITSHPGSAIKCEGEPIAFSVSATGTAVSYQWRKDGNDIPGATSDTYTIASIATGDAGDYDVLVSGACTPAETSTPATLTVQTPPSIANQPADDTRCTGQSVSFTVAASGTDLAYQWRKDGNDIPGATGDTYTIASVAIGDAGDYDVLVTGACSPSQTSSVATLSVINSAILTYSGTANFTASVVYPLSAGPSTGFRFEMKYTDPGGNFPQPGDPKLHLDYEGNGMFTDPNDVNLTMYPLDAEDMDVTDGKRYYIELPTLPLGTDYEVTYSATSTSGCYSTFGPTNGPSVITASNLVIFSSDISFSDMHPSPGTNITVSAVIRNLTPTAASNVGVRLVNQAYPLTTYPDIIVPSLAGNSSTTISWGITTPNVPSWNPMQIIVDHTNAVAETNELDNQAIRPFVNGNFAVAGDITVTSSPSPSSVCPAPNTFVNVCGSAQYTNTTVPSLSPDVAGAGVTIHVVETDQSFFGTTNTSGDFGIRIPTPISTGQYHLEISVTDYTISGQSVALFTVLSPCAINGPDLISSINLSANEIFAGGSVTGSVTVLNVGNQASTASTTSSTAPYSSPSTTATVPTPALGPGLSHSFSISPITFTTPGYYTISAMANSNLQAYETRLDNNASAGTIRVCPTVPDLAARYQGALQVYRCDPMVMAIDNRTCLPVNAPFTVALQVSQNNVVISTYTQTVTNTVPRDGTVFVTFSNAFPASGMYQIQIIVDNGSVIDELDENNNSFANSVEVVNCKPDLKISPSCTSVATTDPQSPGMLTVNTTLTNIGNAVAQAPFIVDFESNGNHYPVVISTNLSGGHSVNVPVTIPTPPSVCSVLNITADATSVVDEIDESNNTAQVKLNLDFSLGNSLTCGGASSFWNHVQHVGTPVTLSVGLNNSGGYRASVVATQFEISGPGINGWLNLGSANNADVGQTCGCPVAAVLPTQYLFLQTGTYYVRMTADAAQSYAECDETNNVLVVAVEVAQSPDYRILSEYIAPSLLNPAIAQPISVALTYENIGNTGSSEMDLGVKVDDIPLDQVRVSGLVQNATNSILFTNQWSSTIPGLHVIRGIVDVNNEISETDETNNQATRAVVVGPTANLAFTQFAASDQSPALNTPISIQTVIQNTGPVDCNAELKIYYTDETSEDILFSQQPITVLASGSLTIHVPWSVLNRHTTLTGRLENFSVPQSSSAGKEAQDAIGNTCTASISVSGSTSFCEGGSVVLTASDGISWLWSNNETTRSITVTTGGDYSVTVTDATLCAATSPAEHVTVFPLPSVTVAAGGPITFCEGGSVTLTASGADSYVWSNAATTPSITVSASGTYSVMGMNANGCTAASGSVTVAVEPLVNAGSVSGTSPLCSGSNAIFTTNGTPGGSWHTSNSTIATVDPSSGLVTGVTPGSTTITYTLNSGCGSPVMASFAVQVSSCLTYCTFTQGYYGNSIRAAFINTLLPITVGKPGRSLTFETNQGACVASRLPGGGPASALPTTLGEYSAGSSGCPSNTVIPLNSTGRFNNILLGQTIALALNVRSDAALASFALPTSFCTQQDAQSAIDGPYLIPSSVFSALTNLSLQQNVSGLLELANRALAGYGTGGASLSEINSAVNAINVGFDECRTLVSCQNPKSVVNSAGTSFSLHGNFPNPFNPSTTISYSIPADAAVQLRVYDALGREVAVLVNEMKSAGTHNVQFDAGNLNSGLYLYRLIAHGSVLNGKMSLMK